MRREVSLSLMLALISGTAVAIISWQMFAAPDPAPVQKVVESGIDLTTVVVATTELSFGAALSPGNLREVQWPSEGVPRGAFRSMNELFAEQQSRAALQLIEPGEVVLRGRITGPGQRASLSAVLSEGKKALSIRVNDVLGVSGFVLPNDRVDILLTRADKDEKGGKDAYTDILLQDIKVLAIDQIAAGKSDQAKVVKAVTVEATLEQAQMITLGANVGELSLALRHDGSEPKDNSARRITVADLAGDSGDKDATATFQPTMAVAPEAPKVAPKTSEVTITIVRSATSTDYSIKRTNRDR